MIISRRLAQAVATHVNRDWGPDTCDAEDVLEVADTGTLAAPGREDVASWILQEFEELRLS